MDQIKTGRFIASLRKERKYTQAQLAEILGISDKTVSKWERGAGMPEVSLMLPLCEALGINVNELLTGQRLDDADYKKKAEENMMNLVSEKEESKKKILLSVLMCAITLVAAVALILTASLFEMAEWCRAIYIGLGILVMVGGIAVAAMLDMSAGTFECPKCGERFVPSSAAYIAGPHTITKRLLKCPKCNEKSYCKRRLTH